MLAYSNRHLADFIDKTNEIHTRNKTEYDPNL